MLKQLKTITNNNSEQKGFTIIEVMIVLAIAGLIILIVLLAVPALQRNGRNTAIKNDASAVVAGISESKSNNDGAPPTAVSTTAGGSVTIKNGAAGSDTNAKVQGGTVVQAAPGNTTPAGNLPVIGNIELVFGIKCEKAGIYAPGVPGDKSQRSVSVYYSVEISGGTVQKCIEA